jgi:hypothetical protein
MSFVVPQILEVETYHGTTTETVVAGATLVFKKQ